MDADDIPGFPWAVVNPTGTPTWHCPHCLQDIISGRTFYYNHHFKGRCLPGGDAAAAGGASDEGFPESVEQAIAAMLQQLASAGMPQAQLLLLWPTIQQLLQAAREQPDSPPVPGEDDDDDIEDAGGADGEGKDAPDLSLDELLAGSFCEGSSVSAAAAWTLLFDYRLQHQIKDRAFNGLCKLLKRLLPPGAVVPSDLRQARRVLGIKRPASYAHLACKSGRCYLTPEQLKNPPAGATCACGLNWFDADNQSLGQVFYLLDPAEAIRELFQDPVFAQARGAGVNKVIGSWYASKHFTDLNNRTGGQLDDACNSAWDLGGDSVNLTLSRKDSTAVFVLRCRGLPEHLRAQCRFVLIIMVVPGGKGGATPWHACLTALGKALGKLAEEGVSVRPGQPGDATPDGRLPIVLGPEFKHKAFISTLYADAPFAAKLMYWVAGFTAVLACAFCRLTGQRMGPGLGVMRYLGFTAAVIATAGVGNRTNPPTAYSMPNAGRHTSKDMQTLVNTAQARRNCSDVAARTGFHGLSPLLEHLPYQDVRTFHVVPFMHAFCHGVFKGFMRALLVSLSKQRPSPGPAAGGSSSAQGGQQPAAAAGAAAAAGPEWALRPGQRMKRLARAVVARRSAGFARGKGGLHPQHNRPVTDPVKYINSMTFEEVAGGVRGLFAHMLRPFGADGEAVLHDDVVKEAYGHLRAFGHHSLTQGAWATEDEYEADVKRAHGRLLDFARLAERDFMRPAPPLAECNSSLCTYNLHSLVCRLEQQAVERGHTTEYLESFLETKLGSLARWTRGRVVRDPAHVAVSGVLDERGLQAAARRLGVEVLSSSDGLVGLATTPDDLAEVEAHTAAAEGGAIGPGHAVAEDWWATHKDTVRQGLHYHELWDEAWDDCWDQQPELAQVYERAMLDGGVLVTSTLYKRHQTRNGTRVLVPFATNTQQRHYRACEAQLYIVLRQPPQQGQAGGQVVLAGVFEFKAQQVVDDDIADLLLVGRVDDFETNQAGEVILRFLPLDCISNALDVCEDDGQLSFTPVVSRSKRIAFARS